MGNPKKITSAYCNDILGTMDGVELAKRIAAREIQASEAVEAAIARAQRVNPSLNAIVTETFEQALHQANTSISGPFAGVPSIIKDLENVKGVPTLSGSRAMSKKPVRTSSRFVKQYYAMGFINLGKSAVPEFGLNPTTEPLANVPTRNPWNLDHSSGGSSGGAAALVAAGVVPIAHGNDGGGSIRMPAACCGLVGLKPSRNRLPNMEGTGILPINLVNQGILSRTVRDTAAFYAAAERYYFNPKLPKMGLVEHPGKQRLRIALLTDAPNVSLDDPTSMNPVMEAARVCEALNHKVEKIPFPFPAQVMDDFFIYWGWFAFLITLIVNTKKLESYTLGWARHYRKNIFRSLSSIRRLRKFSQPYEAVFNTYDILLSPTVSTAAPKLGYLSSDVDFDIVFERLRKFMPFTPYQNIAGAPAISLPMGQQNGLPVGVQFAAAYGQDKRLLELALELEEARPWPRLGDV